MRDTINAPVILAIVGVGWVRWVLAQGWWLLLGGWLGLGLRSALGGQPALEPDRPPTRPRRPKPPRARRGQLPLPYPSAA